MPAPPCPVPARWPRAAPQHVDAQAEAQVGVRGVVLLLGQKLKHNAVAREQPLQAPRGGGGGGHGGGRRSLLVGHTGVLIQVAQAAAITRAN